MVCVKAYISALNDTNFSMQASAFGINLKLGSDVSRMIRNKKFDSKSGCSELDDETNLYYRFRATPTKKRG
jgi:hypothetical protein